MKKSSNEQTAAQLWAIFNPNKEELFWSKYELVLQGKAVNLPPQEKLTPPPTTTPVPNALPQAPRLYSHGYHNIRNALTIFIILFLVVSVVAIINFYKSPLYLRISAPVGALLLPLFLGKIYRYKADETGLIINNVFTPNKQKFLWDELESVDIRIEKVFTENRNQFRYHFQLIIRSKQVNKYFLLYFPLKVSGTQIDEYRYPLQSEQVQYFAHTLQQKISDKLTLPRQEVLKTYGTPAMPNQAITHFEKVPFLIFLIPNFRMLGQRLVYLISLWLPWFLCAAKLALVLSALVFMFFTFTLQFSRLESRDNALVIKKISTFTDRHFSWGNIHSITLKAKKQMKGAKQAIDYNYSLVIKAHHVHTVFFYVFHLRTNTRQVKDFEYPLSKKGAKWLCNDSPIQLRDKLNLPTPKALQMLNS
ncbi:hypothetical protein [Microscilla marina]|uniref:Uncharacterized protein n=1 Tax=Microscilla marina ATCC 23134 TaxID=313606 RepID=A1ZTB5_MICM2|nr:hypothetical protein [Microscilla marina]EAY26337.1 hypothetical protein M23134_04615 [Microscilla marina ATCC 23134]